MCSLFVCLEEANSLKFRYKEKEMNTTRQESRKDLSTKGRALFACGVACDEKDIEFWKNLHDQYEVKNPVSRTNQIMV